MQLDSLEQWAKLYYFDPVAIDLPAIVAAAKSADFPIVRMELEVAGTLERAACDHCATERTFLRTDGSQAWELDESMGALAGQAEGDFVRIRAEVLEGLGDHPRLRVSELVPNVAQESP